MNIFLISDTHFGQESILTFKRSDGITPLRSFSSMEEMNEVLIENWNKTVRPQDKIYHLGDFSMHKKFIPILERLNGEKVLIRGNHDTDKLSVYQKYFKDVRGSWQLDKFLLTHIPIHPNSLGRWKANIHGHLHSNNVMIGNEEDPRYINVSCEQINYTPISLEDLNKIYNERFPNGFIRQTH